MKKHRVSKKPKTLFGLNFASLVVYRSWGRNASFLALLFHIGGRFVLYIVVEVVGKPLVVVVHIVVVVDRIVVVHPLVWVYRLMPVFLR